MNEKDDLSPQESDIIKDFSAGEDAVNRFSPEQMNHCPACRRANPPTRLACFYCGAKLEITTENQNFVRPALRKLENWEKGFNVVLTTQSDNAAKTPSNELSAFLRLEKDDLRQILKAETALPLARVESVEEAELVKSQLEKNGFATVIVSDSRLLIETAPRRVRGLEFAEGKLRLRISGKNESVELDYKDLKLFVVGSTFQSRREESARRSRSGEVKKVGETSEFSMDERILDFYAADDMTGYRIAAGNFDFSCLGERKRLLARENFGILLEDFRSLAGDARFNDSYQKARLLLNLIWNPEERRESTGWQHEGIGKVSVGSRTTVGNEAQFTRYSRMLAYLSK